VAKAAKAIGVDPSVVADELRRLTESPGLLHAESLCLLLHYLVRHALEKPEEHIGEYQIAVDVFGRPETFDPRIDSTVRVQTSRLRNKLIEYYATTGTRDSLVIEIPRGAYSAVFHWRSAEPVPLPVSTAEGPTPVQTKALDKATPPWLRTISIVPGIALGLAAGLLLSFFLPSRTAQKTGPDRTELRTFWSSVLKSPSPPLVIFSNAEFKGRPESGLRYFDPQSDSREHVNDLYTGIGEVLAIAELSDVFRVLNREMVVKRSGLLSWDETKNRDLIFAGSPTENLSLRDLPLSQEFVFRPMRAGEPRPGDLAIVNEHPRAGEPALFFATASLPLTEDYAVVMLQTGMHQGQSVLSLAGTTTLGTQAAAEFVCQNENLGVLRKRLGLAPGRPYNPFSAVLHVRVARGVPVETSIAALHSPGK
jgi:hypothetical protein